MKAYVFEAIRDIARQSVEQRAAVKLEPGTGVVFLLEPAAN